MLVFPARAVQVCASNASRRGDFLTKLVISCAVSKAFLISWHCRLVSLQGKYKPSSMNDRSNACKLLLVLLHEFFLATPLL